MILLNVFFLTLVCSDMIAINRLRNNLYFHLANRHKSGYIQLLRKTSVKRKSKMARHFIILHELY